MASKEKKDIAQKQSTPLSPFEDMEHWFDQISPNRWMQPFRMEWPAWPDLETPFKGRFPKVDLINRDKEIVVKAELPGVKKENVDVSMTDDTVTLKATTQSEKDEEKDEYHRREISQGEFQRTLTLPEAVESGKASASFKDGILELTIPKLKPAKRQSVKVK